MSPLELPGKSFGQLPDRRNRKCPKCGGGFRDYAMNLVQSDSEDGLVELACPYCGYQFEIVNDSGRGF